MNTICVDFTDGYPVNDLSLQGNTVAHTWQQGMVERSIVPDNTTARTAHIFGKNDVIVSFLYNSKKIIIIKSTKSFVITTLLLMKLLTVFTFITCLATPRRRGYIHVRPSKYSRMGYLLPQQIFCSIC